MSPPFTQKALNQGLIIIANLAKVTLYHCLQRDIGKRKYFLEEISPQPSQGLCGK